MHGGLDLLDKALRFQVFDHAPARREPIHPAILRRRLVIEVRGRVEDIDDADLGMALIDPIVVEIVGRRDLDGARALLGIGVVIGDDGNLAPDQRQHHRLADQLFVTRVVGMHGNRRVAEHRLGPRGGDDDEARGIALQRVPEVIEMPVGIAGEHLPQRVCVEGFVGIARRPTEGPLGVDHLDFEVGERRLELRVPVDEALVLVDQVPPVRPRRIGKLDEHLEDGLGQALVHGEALARPVARRAQPLQLAEDGAAALGLPGPHLLDELLAPELVPVRLLPLHQLALDHHLRGDAGMVRARLPEHVLAAHALEAAEHVLQRVVERVPPVQRARDVRRRDDDAIGLRFGPLGTAGLEGLRLHPVLVDARLDVGGPIGLLEHEKFAGSNDGGCSTAPKARGRRLSTGA